MNKIQFRIIIAFIIPLVSLQAIAQQPVAQRVQAYLDSVQKANGFPGMTVTFIRGGDKPVSLATGFADKEAGVAMKPDAIMLSGSTPKMFYAMVAMKLAEQEKISIDDKISKYLGSKPWFSRLPNSQDITIRHLLQHTSGIPEYYTYGDFMKRIHAEPDKNWTLEELIGYILDQPAKNKSGEHFGYADTNYLVLGLLVEELTSKKMYTWVNEMIVSPLKLKQTRPSDSRKLNGLITGYSMPNSIFGFSGATLKDGLFVVNPQFELMGGGYVSTTPDWANFIHAVFKGKVVSEASLTAMKQGMAANTGRDHQYGLGLQIRPSAYGTGYGHGGWFPGYLTEVEYFPEKDIAIAVQCNTDDRQLVKGQLRGHVLKMMQILTNH